MPIAEVRVCLTTNKMAIISKPFNEEDSNPLEQVTELESCGVPHPTGQQVEHNTYTSKILPNGVQGLSTNVKIPASELMSRGKIMPSWTKVFEQSAGMQAGVLFRDYIEQNLPGSSNSSSNSLV